MDPDKQLPQIPLPSIDDLVMLVFKKSGYKMQISGEDPLLSVVYLNQAVLGATLLFAKEKFAEENKDHLERIERNYRKVIDELLNYREQTAKNSPDRHRESPEQRDRRIAIETAQQHQRMKDANLTAEATARLLQQQTAPMMASLAGLTTANQQLASRLTQAANKLYVVIGGSIVASACLAVLIGKWL